MQHLLSIAAGGALGALSRYWLGAHVHRLWDGGWPLGTLLINASGSLLIGIVFVLLEREQLHPDWRSVLMIGFLGAFTTFSTFSLETVELWQRGDAGVALAYVAGSIVSCVGGAALGMALTRWFFSA